MTHCTGIERFIAYSEAKIILSRTDITICIVEIATFASVMNDKMRE